MRAQIDTNIFLDIIFNRTQFYDPAAKLLTRVTQGDVEAYLAAHAVTTVYYLVARNESKETAYFALTELLQIVKVAPVDQNVINRALHYPQQDFEDAVTMVAAVAVGADCVVTRDASGFATGPLPVYTAAELLSRF